MSRVRRTVAENALILCGREGGISVDQLYREDREFVDRLLRGDEAAFDSFVEEYYPRLYRFAFPRMGSDPETTLDVVQATFEKVLPKLGRYRAEAALFSWMCTFCRFEIAAHWRRLGRTAPEVSLVESSPEVRAALESLAALEEGPEGIAERRELARLVRSTLDHLPLRYGRALDLKYLRGLSVREVAARLDLSPKAAESLLTRARQAFRDGFATVVGGATP
jgi:RNA polymerase sigma-70 factor (ECF subfamily)